MERNTSRLLPQTPEEKLEDSPEVSGSLPVYQRRHRQRGHLNRPNEPQKDVQQPPTAARVSNRQFHENVLLLHHNVDAHDDSLPPRLENELQRRFEARYSGPLPRHLQKPGDNSKTPSKMSTDAVTPESTDSGPISAAVSQELESQSYVEKRREEQQVHAKAHLGDVGTRLQRKASRGRHIVKNTLFKGRGLPDLQQILARRRKRKADPGTISQLGLHDGQSLAAPVNWPFGCKATSRDSGRTRHHSLAKRGMGLLLRNPPIRDGNMGPLPTPTGLTPPQPPPHVYGIHSEARETGRVSCLQVPRLPGLRRRNAQRRNPKPVLQEDFESLNDRFNARFRRGTAARDVHVKYASPVELVRRRSMLAQIQEAPNESSASEPTQREGGETGPYQKDESHQHARPTTDEKDTSSEQKTQHQSGGDKIPMAELYKDYGLRRFSLVIRGPRPAPTSPSTSSSNPTALSSSATLTPETRASTPPSEIELQPRSEPESRTQNGSGCGTPGRTRANCSHIRGTFQKPLPGAAGKEESENGGGSSAAAERSEDDIVPLGNGFSFLRLN